MKTLFCFPSSGSAASMYQPWKVLLAQHNIELVALEYPARGIRFSDKPVDSIAELTHDLLNQIKPKIKHATEFAFLGHSLGGLVCFETTRLLSKLKLPLPSKLIVSARQGPLCHLPSSLSSRQTDDKIIKTLKTMGGITDEVLAHTELMALMLPIIRADLKLNEEYRCSDTSAISVPITAIYGSHDPVVEKRNVEQWYAFTESEFELIEMPGDHFYFNQNLQLFVTTIAQQLHNKITIL